MNDTALPLTSSRVSAQLRKSGVPGYLIEAVLIPFDSHVMLAYCGTSQPCERSQCPDISTHHLTLNTLIRTERLPNPGHAWPHTCLGRQIALDGLALALNIGDVEPCAS